MRRWPLAVGVFGVGIAVGIATLRVARDNPGYGFAGSSDAAAVALLAAGWALIGCGLASWARRPSSRFGLLLTAAGFAWFVPEWTNPEIGSALAFTIGLAFFSACAPLVAHAALAYPAGRLASRTQTVAVTAGYVGGLLVLGLLPAFLYDPQGEGCTLCPDNLVLLKADAGAAEDVMRAGLYLGVGWALALAGLAAWKLAHGSRAGRPVVASAAVYLLLVATTFSISLDRGFVDPGTDERRLWLGQAAALVALASFAAWNLARARRARSQVAGLVAELTRTTPPGGLRDVLAGIAGDPALVLAYPIGDPERLVDGDGRPVELTADLETTSLVQDGQAVAVLGHRPGLLDDEQLVEEVAAAARLALENERLQAEVRSRLAELRASRARIVEAGDAERKRLERDLHDGAQQRLVGLSLSIRLLRGRVADPGARLAEAENELRQAAAELRELAHGIFPAVLADEGLAAALEALAEEGRVPIRVDGIPEARYDASVETAAYTVVAEAARTSTKPLAVGATASDGLLVVEVTTQENGLDLTALEDRVGALDGRLALVRGTDGAVTIRVELPCES